MAVPYLKVPFSHWWPTGQERASSKRTRRKKDEKESRSLALFLIPLLIGEGASERAAGKKVGGIQDALPLLSQPTDTVACGGRGRRRVAKRAGGRTSALR